MLAVVTSLVEVALVVVFYVAIRMALNGRFEVKRFDWSIEATPEWLLMLGGVLLLVGVIRFWIGMMLERHVAELSGEALADLQSGSMRAHLKAPLSIFWKGKGGRFIFHINNLPGRTREFLQNVPVLISSVTMIAMVSIVLACLSWKLLLASAILGGIYALFLQRVSHHVYYLACAEFDRLGKKLAETSHEALAGLRQIRVFQSEERWSSYFEEVARAHAREYARHRWWTLLPQKSLELGIVLLVGGGLILYASLRSHFEGFNLSIFITFVFGMLRLTPYLVQAGRSYGLLVSTLPSVENYFDHLKQIESREEMGNPLPFRQGESVEVALDRVTFRYGDGPEVLKDVSLTLEPGAVTALVGLSGSGKSTLIDIILGLVEPTRGSVLCNKINLDTIRMSEWLKEVALSSQDSFLFHDTLENNLRVAHPDASDEQLREACRLAGVDEFLDGLAQGMKTMIGDRGLTLSGGQRQRMALARALVKPAPVLILDEPTSALDSKIEEKIYRQLWPHLKKRTTLIVSHNLNVISRADRIHVMMNGVIQQSGTHDELVSVEGIYRDLFCIQYAASPLKKIAPEEVPV